MSDRSLPMEINVSSELCSVTFSATGKYLVSGGDAVRVWQTDDGQLVPGSMEAEDVECLAISRDGRWIAAGTSWGHVLVWDATTFEQVFKDRKDRDIHGVDFSPDSTRLVSAAGSSTATVWDLATRRQLFSLPHENWVIAARYSPQGDRIATATYKGSVQIWDNDNGRLLVDIPVEVTPHYNRGLLWFDNHLLVVSDGKIKEFDASTESPTGSLITEWSVSNVDEYSCIALPRHGGFIAYSAGDTVTFWDTATHSQLVPIQHLQDIHSIALSPDGQLLAIAGDKGMITIQNISRIVDPIPSYRLHPTLQEPELHVNDAVLDMWKHDRLENAEALLTAAIAESRIPNHYELAGRALVRARLQQWDTSLNDAKMAIEIQPSVLAYIAKGMAHVGNNEKYKAYRSCDIAVIHHPPHVTFLLLIKAIIVFLAGEHSDAISRMDDLIATVHFNSILHVVQAYMLLLLGNSHVDSSNYDNAIDSFERARALRPHPNESHFLISLISGWRFDDLEIKIGQRICEALYSSGRIKDACDSLLELVHTLDEEVYQRESIAGWVSAFTQQCLSTPEGAAMDATHGADSAVVQTSPTPLLREWAKATLVSLPWRDALATTVAHFIPRFIIYQVICEHLETGDRITDAVECLLEMEGELTQSYGQYANWVTDAKYRLSRKLEYLGDLAMDAQQPDQAVGQYSVALSLYPADLQALLAKRSRARAAMGEWRGALDDADEVIHLDPSSPLGYERKYTALRIAGSYSDAEAAFETMLYKMSKSPDPEIRERCRSYIRPAEAEAAIRDTILFVIRESPPILINTESGHLLDKSGQASSFELQPVFHELVSSTTTHVDRPRIEDQVGRYYRYATFSHTWEANEPMYEDAICVAVYELGESSTHDKLQKFCKTVREAGLHWAWSDTVCIKKMDSSFVQEALVSMFQWYQSSTLTVVLLSDVPWRRLVDSRWNTRAWTLLEYHASKVVRFYDREWTLYRGIDVPNHKESPEIIAEMEEATGISAQSLMALQLGPEDIREKLRLVSRRNTVRIEDTAYSLLGMFSLSMPVVYGEGNRALGRLLAQLLTSSGDTSILAWTGRSNSFNSCLPADISVFSEPPATHIPHTITSVEMEATTAELRQASLSLAAVTKLYNRLNQLPAPFFTGVRMKLPCMVFKLGPLSVARSGSENVFHAHASALGTVEIKTDKDLLQFRTLMIIHPWIDFLLDRQAIGSTINVQLEENTEDPSSSLDEVLSLLALPDVASSLPAGFNSRLSLNPMTALRRFDLVSRLPPSVRALMGQWKHSLQVLARLRQPFGALLFTPDDEMGACRRVAAEILITVQLKEITQQVLDRLVSSIRVVDVI